MQFEDEVKIRKSFFLVKYETMADGRRQNECLEKLDKIEDQAAVQK